MGQLVDGVWQNDVEQHKGGHFVRPATTFRNWVTADGAPGPSGEGGFAAEPGRYHLYVSLACPWASRAIIFRKLKKLYLAADPRFTGRVTVPVLWDRKRNTIVNNESSEVIRMLNSAFDKFTDAKADYYPPALRAEIDRINDIVYPNINNGVYRAGFAKTQKAYEQAFRNLFDALDEMEELLGQRRYLAGKQLTEADWRLFTTLVRFDAVYYVHFKCNWRHIWDYPNLSNYMRELYQMSGIAGTVSLEHIKNHYYGSQLQVNPTGIVPLGPQIDFSAPHDRARLG
jgi:putative glutathione S-transferase